MAKFKAYNPKQGVFLSVFFDKQIHPGTFEYTLSHLVDYELDLSIFNDRFKNDETGAPAYDPKILLKIILFAYSRGITSSRKIEQACQENVVFMALSANTRPHFTTIADFISSMDKEIVQLFLQVLLVSDEQGLIGKEMFAIDGCKLPSNASKEWSGTRADFKKKAVKMEKAIESIVNRHHTNDQVKSDKEVVAKEKKYESKLRKNLKKVKDWLDDNDDKMGKSGKPIKSNITDNESAKMKTSKGVIQGYVGVAAVDSKHQVIVSGEAFGKAQEHDLLEPMVNDTQSNFQLIGKDENVFEKAKLTADSGFHSEANMKMLAEKEIDGYVADVQFRKRDPRFKDYDRYKVRARKERRSQCSKSKKLFSKADFFFPADLSYCLCPAGKRLYRCGGNVTKKNFTATQFKGRKTDCVPCSLRSRCLRYPDRTESRQVAYFHGRSEQGKNTFSEKMRRKIDSIAGRTIYGKRLAVGEPPFAHIRSAIGLDRFSLRTKHKVNIQWNLFCIIHNLKKIHRYGIGFA